MSDDLERRLRDERGPRERGYQPIHLPSTPVRPDGHGPGALRWGLFAATALAAVLAVGVAARGLPLGSDGVGSGSPAPSVPPDRATATPAAASSAPSAPDDGLCQPANLVLLPEQWGGAAGSRGTILRISLVDAAAPCELPLPLAVRVRDGDINELVSGTSGDVGTVSLNHGGSVSFSVVWSNWCGDAPGSRLGWDVRFGDGDWLAIAEDVAAGNASVPVPPCNGEGGTNLEVTRID